MKALRVLAILTASTSLTAAEGGGILTASSDDAAAAFDGGSTLYQVLRRTDAFINIGRQGTAGVFRQSIVIPFQLPDLGAVTDPFGGASLTFRYVTRQNITAASFNVDLYGLAPRSSAEILPAVASDSDPGDFHMGATDETPGVIKLQEDIITPATPQGTTITTTESGSEALAGYLNAAYNNGAGAGAWVFLRLSMDGTPGGVSRYAVASADEPNEAMRPYIAYELVERPDSFQLTIAPATLPTTGFVLEWESRAGKLYNLRTSSGLDGAIHTWDVVEADIAATPPTNIHAIDPPDLRRFYAVEAFDAPPPPPLFFADFESGADGFTNVTDAGSTWEWGAPVSDNQSNPPFALAVAQGNNGSVNCWGINLGTLDEGFYTNPTTTRLRSPVIDLTGVAAAFLSFAEAVDFSDTDTAMVFIIDPLTDDALDAAPIHESANLAYRTADWAPANDGNPIPLPAVALDRAIRLEWRFTGESNAFIGWYLDDVAVFTE